MTDLVVGGGAVGSLVGWALAAGGRDVAIVRRAAASRAAPAELTVVDPKGEPDGRSRWPRSPGPRTSPKRRRSS